MPSEPYHTSKTFYYFVLRPILWFPKDSKITTDKMREYFTPKAIQSLLKHEFIIIKSE